MPRLMFPLLLLAGVCACSSKNESTDLTNQVPFAAAIAKADRVTVYEGLPHQAFEAESLEKERQTKPTVTFHGFSFYTDPLELKPEDVAALTALAADAGSIQSWRGEKKCGGFHPDYVVEWTVRNDAYRMLVCFGCGEVRLFGTKQAIRADMSGDGKKGLEAILKPLRKNRPERQE